MRSIWILFKQDLLLALTQRSWAILMIVLICMSYAILWFFPQTSYLTYGYASTDLYWIWLTGMLIVFIPLMYSRMPKEAEDGLYDVWRSRGIAWMDILLFKFFAGFSLSMILMGLTLPHLAVVSAISEGTSFQLLELVIGIIGSILLMTIFCVISLIVSAFTSNTALMVLLAMLLSLIMHQGISWISELPFWSATLSYEINRYSLSTVIAVWGIGLVSLTSILYVVSLIGFGFFIAHSLWSSKSA